MKMEKNKGNYKEKACCRTLYRASCMGVHCLHFSTRTKDHSVASTGKMSKWVLSFLDLLLSRICVVWTLLALPVMLG